MQNLLTGFPASTCSCDDEKRAYMYMYFEVLPTTTHVPLYTGLHAALRELCVKHRLLKKELFDRGDALARNSLIATDLNAALEDNNSLSMRVVRLEAQLDAARRECRLHEHEAKSAREHLSTLAFAG